ncbi:MAG: flagellar protein FlgN [Candidatus Omnitrophica bacterium]|nr:flagellar protein FlgN [Candidatus Omnitrophota bacterium]
MESEAHGVAVENNHGWGGAMTEQGEQVGKSIKAKLEEQLRCYAVIHELSRRQKEMLDHGDTAVLMGLLAKKQKFVTRIDLLQGELQKLRQDWDGVKDAAPTALKSELRTLTGKIARVLEETVDLEKQNIDIAESRQKEIKQKMRDMQAGKQAISGYLAAGRPAGARYMDRKM